MVVPFLLALPRDGDRARVEQRLHNVYCSLRPLSDNSVTRYMKSRIFQEGPAAGEVVRSMRRQQGLMQIFHDYCESDSTTCEACGFLAAVEAARMSARRSRPWPRTALAGSAASQAGLCHTADRARRRCIGLAGAVAKWVLAPYYLTVRIVEGAEVRTRMLRHPAAGRHLRLLAFAPAFGGVAFPPGPAPGS